VALVQATGLDRAKNGVAWRDRLSRPALACLFSPVSNPPNYGTKALIKKSGDELPRTFGTIAHIISIPLSRKKNAKLGDEIIAV
jgi:hypothetical protein